MSLIYLVGHTMSFYGRQAFRRPFIAQACCSDYGMSLE